MPPEFPPNAVLLVDDDQDFGVAMAQSLRERGVEVVTAMDSLQAIELLAIWRPTAILLDLMLPVMSGLELLKHIRREPHLASIPVFLMTASRCTAVEGTPVFHKPVNIDSITRAVHACLAVS